jgi:hypothetical protein
MLNGVQIGTHHFHRLTGIGYVSGYVRLYPLGSPHWPCLTAVPSRHHASWTLLCRSSSSSVDRARRQTSCFKRLVSSDVTKEAKEDLQEMLDDEATEEQKKRIAPPRHHDHLIDCSRSPNKLAAPRTGL